MSNSSPAADLVNCSIAYLGSLVKLGHNHMEKLVKQISDGRSKLRRLRDPDDRFWNNKPRWQSGLVAKIANSLAQNDRLSVETLSRIEYATARILHQPLSPSAWGRMTFNDKVMFRRLRVHDPKFATFTDKLRTRDYVNQRLGQGCTPDLFRVSKDANAFSDLVGPFALKANHGSGWVIIVETARTLTARELESAKSWVSIDYGRSTREWAYALARPLLYAEELLTPFPPPDYKIHTFNGVPRMIQVDTDRFGDHRRILMRPDWTPLGGLGYPLPCGGTPEPPNLKGMLAWASILAEGMDYLRIDLYDMIDRILVGELTCYPGAGSERFRPSSLDVWLGRNWTARPS